MLGVVGKSVGRGRGWKRRKNEAKIREAKIREDGL